MFCGPGQSSQPPDTSPLAPSGLLTQDRQRTGEARTPREKPQTRERQLRLARCLR